MKWLTLLITTALLSLATAQDKNPWLGKKIPAFQLADGTIFKDATITRIDPDAIVLTHAAGVRRIAMEDLREESRAALGYDPVKATAARKAAEKAHNTHTSGGWVRYFAKVHASPSADSPVIGTLRQKAYVTVADSGDRLVEVEMISAPIRDPKTDEHIPDGPSRPTRGYILRENFTTILPRDW